MISAHNGVKFTSYSLTILVLHHEDIYLDYYLDCHGSSPANRLGPMWRNRVDWSNDLCFRMDMYLRESVLLSMPSGTEYLLFSLIYHFHHQ